MNTLECARHLSNCNMQAAAIELYEKHLNETQTQPLVSIGTLLAVVAQAGRSLPEEKTQQIKYVRERLNIGFKDAKEIVEAILWNTLPH